MNTRRRYPRTNARSSVRTERRGAILYTALVVLIPLAALTYGLVTIVVSFEEEKRHRVRDEQALVLAEAGLDEAMIALRLGGSGAVGTAAAPAYLADGMVWVEVQQIGNDILSLQSSAMYKSGRASVETLVFSDHESMLDTAIFSNLPLQAASNVLVDSFDSSSGSYAGQVSNGVAGDGAILESNGDVTLDATTEVYGDIHPGTEYSVSMASNASVSGLLQPLDSARSIETISVPVVPSAGPANYAGAVTLPTGTYGFDDVMINGDVVVEGPATLVVDSLELLSNSSLTFDTSAGAVDVYVRDEFILASNSAIITTEPSATLLTLYLLGTTADLRSNAAFYGRIVAPNAAITVRSNFEVYGAILAEEVTLSSNVRLHYDLALLGLATGPPTYTRFTWARVGFPDTALLGNRRDPFRVLGLDPGALNLPADAHDQP